MQQPTGEPVLPCVLDPDHPGDHLPGPVHDIDPDFPVCPAAAGRPLDRDPGRLADAVARVLELARRHIRAVQLAWIDAGPAPHQRWELELARRHIRAVQLAWIDAGPAPHQQAQADLFRTWPVLATAVAELAGETPTGGRP